jgi:hypothetical protein
LAAIAIVYTVPSGTPSWGAITGTKTPIPEPEAPHHWRFPLTKRISLMTMRHRLSPEHGNDRCSQQAKRMTTAAILVDSDLDVHGVDEVGRWAAAGVDIQVIDSDTGEDITRIVFAHWKDGRVVDPIGG